MPEMIATDSETHAIQPGLLAPPGVCGSFYDGENGWIETFPDWLDSLEGALRPGVTLALANAAYDFAVACAESKGGVWEGRPRLLKLIFDKIDRGEVFDILIAAALNYVADGMLFKNPHTGGPLQRLPDADGKWGKQMKRYSLEVVYWLTTGKFDAKDNDEFRLRYHEFDGKPISEYPEKARIYPVDDARHTFIAARALRANGKNLGKLERHEWTHLTHQQRAAWAMHLMSCWGLRTNAEAVDKLDKAVEAEYARTFEVFKKNNLIKWDGRHFNEDDDGNKIFTIAAPGDKIYTDKQSTDELSRFKIAVGGEMNYSRGTWKDNGVEVKRRLIHAYDPNAGPCSTCKGSGRKPCEVCRGSGRAPSIKTGKDCACHSCKGKPPGCEACSATGLEVPPGVPRTPKDGLCADRDTLNECGDPLLEEFGERSENEKLRNTYLPFLRAGVTRPINVRGNVMTDTARASFEGLIQLLPRQGGVRECFEARPGYWYCSVDFNAGELSTLAQVCLWVVGYSRMAEAINAGRDLHCVLGAQMLQISYEEFCKRKDLKDVLVTAIRQAAKAGNFGFGGLMGAPKFVMTQRKAKAFGEPGAEHGSMCRLAGLEDQPCGTTKITEWFERPCAPVCKVCVDFSAQLKATWLKTWEEMKEYFNWCKAIPGVSEGYGQIVSPGTGYVRGGLNASQAANHSFQHLLAMTAKHALWLVCRECYTDTNSPLYGSRPVVFAHDEIMIETPMSVAHEAGYRLRDVMVNDAAKSFVPDVAIGAEPAWAKRWFKGMKLVVDSTGRAFPWSPEYEAAKKKAPKGWAPERGLTFAPLAA